MVLLDVGRYVKQTRVLVPKVDLCVCLKELELVHSMQVNEYQRMQLKTDEIVEYLESMDNNRG